MVLTTRRKVETKIGHAEENQGSPGQDQISEAGFCELSLSGDGGRGGRVETSRIFRDINP